jgi:hypothetical protein
MLYTFKLTTVALDNDQHLKAIHEANIAEVFCKGYTGGKRDKSLDGYYYKGELKIK